MRIGIDCRVLEEGTGGVFVYASNVLKHLIPLARGHRVALFANRFRGARSAALSALGRTPNVRICRYRFPNKFLNASFAFARWPKIDELLGGCDVLFFPSMLYGAWSERTRVVLTMHDLSYEFFPEFFTLRQRAWHALLCPRRFCQEADAVIAVSDVTRQDVIARYRVSPDKVTTVRSGVDSRFRPVVDRSALTALRARYGLPEGRYILQTGTLEPRKNHLATLAAFERLLERSGASVADVRLLFAGHRGWKGGALLAAVRRSPFRDRIHVVPEARADDVPALYSLASVVAYPSFYEGFGFPVLEAFACGVPVVASATASVGEVAGDAALLVNPHRVDELLFAMRAILNQPAVGKALRARGLERTVHFSWENAARETLNVLEAAGGTKSYAHRN